MPCVSHLVFLVLIWRPTVSALQLGLEEVRAISNCRDGVDVCRDDNRTYMNHRCFCDEKCHLFSECCIDRAVLQDTPNSADEDGLEEHIVKGGRISQDKFNDAFEVFGIPRDRWGCRKLVVTMKQTLPVEKVRMVVRCPEDANMDIFEKCAALNRSSSNFHYIMDIPVLSSASGIWYQNVYCAICNRDVKSLERLRYFFECDRNVTKENMLSEGRYSTEPLEWTLGGQNTGKCQLKTQLQPGATPGFLRPCGAGNNVLLIESCPQDWTDYATAKKCSAYAFYSQTRSNDPGILDQFRDNSRDAGSRRVFKNPHCALCNGVAPQNTTCWLEPSVRTVVFSVPGPSLSIVMNIMVSEDDNQEYRSCKPPDGVWDILHETCIQVDNMRHGERSGRMMNVTCPTITLERWEFHILDNDSLRYIGNTSHNTGRIFDEYELMENDTAIVCALQGDKEDQSLISDEYQGYLTEFCLSLSVTCLILHIGTYCALPKLGNLPGKNLHSLSWALLVAHLVFLIGVKPAFEVPMEVCIGIAVVDYFCFLAAFFWMNVMSVDIWRTFSRSTLRGNGGSKTHMKYAAYAWGTSALLALVALAVDICTEDGAVKPSFGTGKVCWFGNKGGLGLFLAVPLSVLMMVNTGLFASTVYKIWQAKRQGARYIRDKARQELTKTSCRNSDMKETVNTRGNSSGSTRRNDQIRFYLYLKLFVIMGLTWILGFIATLARVTFLWYPFIVFNGLQGAFIFVMFDVKRKIAYMLWDKYVGRRGYQPPGFLLASYSSSATRTTGSSRSKSKDSASSSDKVHLTAANRTNITAPGLRLAPTVTEEANLRCFETSMTKHAESRLHFHA